MIENEKYDKDKILTQPIHLHFNLPDIMEGFNQLCTLAGHYADQLNTLDGGKRMKFEKANNWLLRLRQLKEAGKDTTFADYPDSPNAVTLDMTSAVVVNEEGDIVDMRPMPDSEQMGQAVGDVKNMPPGFLGESVTLQQVPDTPDHMQLSQFGVSKLVGTPKELNNRIEEMWKEATAPENEQKEKTTEDMVTVPNSQYLAYKRRAGLFHELSKLVNPENHDISDARIVEKLSTPFKG